jgi:hypothetical protein
MGSAATFVVAALLLTPAFGAKGTAFAPVIAYGVGIIGVVAMAARASGLPAIRWRKIAVSALTAAACIGSATLLAPRVGELEPLVDLLAILAYPLVVFVAGVVDREHMEPLKRVFRSVVTPRPEPSGLREGLTALAPDDRSLVESLLRHRQPPADVATRLARADAELHERFTGVLRRLADVPGDGTRDAEIGAYLLSPAAVADRDAMARRLWSADVEPGELHALEAAAIALAGERLWRERGEEAAGVRGSVS